MKISGSYQSQPVAKHAFASARHAEARDHERSLERSARDRQIRAYDQSDRLTFGEHLRRENLEAPVEAGDRNSSVGGESESRFAAPKIGDVFPLESDKPAASCEPCGYDRGGRASFQQATSGFTAKLIDVIA